MPGPDEQRALARRLVSEARRREEGLRNAERAAELADRTEMTTFRPADGSYVGGEFAHVSELDWWDDAYEPVKVIGERWVLTERWEVEVPQPLVDLRAEMEAEGDDA